MAASATTLARAASAHPDLEPTRCPRCEAPAELLDRFRLDSTDGPLEHVRIRCLAGRHHFTMPAASGTDIPGRE